MSYRVLLKPIKMEKKMKKLFILSISALFVLGLVNTALAESSSTSVTGKLAEEQCTFRFMYNGSGTDITSNQVVVLDLSNSTVRNHATTLGSYITTNGTAGNSYICGVTDEVIKDGTVGRVCVRGPHRVKFSAVPTAGDSVTNSTTAGSAVTGTSTADKYGYVGTALANTDSTDSTFWDAAQTPRVWWIEIMPHVE